MLEYNKYQKLLGDKWDKYQKYFEGAEKIIETSERGKSGFITIISKELVYKIPIHRDGIIYLKKIINNHKLLRVRGINAIDIRLDNEVGVMDRIFGTTVVEFCESCIDNNDSLSVKNCLDKVYSDIMESSEHSDEISDSFRDISENILKHGFPEMLPQNTFYDGVNTLYIDQECCEKSYQ